MQSKKCNVCGEIKSLEMFSKTGKRNSFKNTHQTHSTYCKSCNAVRAAEWRKQNPNYQGTGKLKNTPKEDRLLMSAIRQRLVDARGRCKKYSKSPPTVTADQLYEIYIKQKRLCALTSAPLNLEKKHPLCLSLDQKDPTKGYTLDNVQWLAWCVNRAKGDFNIEHFYEMCEAVLENRKVQRLSKSSES